MGPIASWFKEATGLDPSEMTQKEIANILAFVIKIEDWLALPEEASGAKTCGDLADLIIADLKETHA